MPQKPIHSQLTKTGARAIKETFVRVLRGIRHNRVEYPQLMEDLSKKFPDAPPLPPPPTAEASDHPSQVHVGKGPISQWAAEQPGILYDEEEKTKDNQDKKDKKQA